MKSPYLLEETRLADVIAAIQGMAASRYHMKSFEAWSKSISGDSDRADHWRRVIVGHPEFFRLDSTKELASLVWRRQFPKDFHVDLGRRLSPSEIEAMSPGELARLSRAPLSPSETMSLVEAAVSLHSGAIELRKEMRWKLALAIGAVGGLVGSIVTAAVKFLGGT